MLEGGLLSKIVSVSEIRFMPNSKKNDQWVHFSLGKTVFRDRYYKEAV